MEIEYADAEDAAAPGRALRPRAEVLGRRGRRAGARQARRRRLGPAQGLRAQGHARHDRPASEALRAAQHWPRGSRSRRIRPGRRSSRTPSSTSRRRTRPRRSPTSSATCSPPSPWTACCAATSGYGKTEVAMRAAIKAVLDGKQVARARADDDPGRPALPDLPAAFRGVSRRHRAALAVPHASGAEGGRARRSPTGSVDILIATHRMLGKDLAFRDLGLLIVDEEQRFGVAQKERLKEWKASIDVLVDVGDADSAFAAPLALGAAGSLDHRDAAAGPAGDRDAGRSVAGPR